MERKRNSTGVETGGVNNTAGAHLISKIQLTAFYTCMQDSIAGSLNLEIKLSVRAYVFQLVTDTDASRFGLFRATTKFLTENHLNTLESVLHLL